MPDTVLRDEQVESFIEHGHLTIRGCFTREDAQPWLDEAWVRLGYDPHDPETWTEKRVHMPSLRHVEGSDFAPRVWRAACQLLGGEERIVQPYTWGNGFIANLGLGADRDWEPPSASSPGWHKDGDFFRHFLDSPEQGLLTIVLWSDIEPRGGGTFVAADSVGPVARLLAERREGILPDDFDYEALITQCASFVETMGRLGDVVLMHPYILHAVSQNHRGTARFITNPPIALREPMRFDREDPAEHSPVERAVLRALGVERLDYRPEAARQSVVPERVRQQQRMSEEEQARLAQARS
ncbi:MAG: hypothetical protein ACXWN5_08865 [Candidatus Limnocylindrales bacterium]